MVTGVGYDNPVRDMVRAIADSAESTEQHQVHVSVLVYDRRLAEDLGPHLRCSQDIRLLPSDESAAADVLLVLTTVVTDALLAELVSTANAATNPAQCIVLVSGPLRERHLARAVSCGVVSILPRRETNARLVIRAVLASHAGRAVLPETVVRWLVDEARSVQQDMLASRGLLPGGLTVREVEVLRLLAEGEDTAHIAKRLSYSERTIKKVLQDVMSRLELRNRAHAVSYAMRVGAI